MQEQQKQNRSKEVRNLIRSLSRVSQIDTKQIRKNIQRQKHLKNQKKSEWMAASDQLLKDNTGNPATNILFSHRLFESKNKKIENFKQKQIDSQAFLKHANFEYRKIEMKKRNILVRQLRSQARYLSAPIINKHHNEEYQKKNQTSPFQMNDFDLEPDHTSQILINRIKTTMNESKKQMRKLYQGHSRQLKSLSLRDKAKLMKKIQNKEQQPVIQQTESILIPKKAKRILNDLIRASTIRSQRVDFQGTQLTEKQKEEILRTKVAIRQMQAGVQVSNKMKESIVLGQLKKLIYGDRRGKFIQDYTFKTRLKGQYSEQYMKILHEQQQLLVAFNGSDASRKHLLQKFSGVLGTLSKQSRSPVHGEVSQFTLS